MFPAIKAGNPLFSPLPGFPSRICLASQARRPSTLLLCQLRALEAGRCSKLHLAKEGGRRNKFLLEVGRRLKPP